MDVRATAAAAGSRGGNRFRWLSHWRRLRSRLWHRLCGEISASALHRRRGLMQATTESANRVGSYKRICSVAASSLGVSCGACAAESPHLQLSDKQTRGRKSEDDGNDPKRAI